MLDDAVKMVQTRQPDFTLDDIPEGDPETYKMLSDGKTNGVFQMESTGMTGVCVGLKPQSIEDITAIIALYRPGPMDSIPKFIACKHDPSKVSYIIPELEPILSITYGCIVYQEQVIQIFQQLAGYTLGQADMLRRAMSKKKAKDVAKEREAFLHGDPIPEYQGLRSQRHRPCRRRKDLRRDFCLCQLCLQQGSCRVLRGGGLPDGLFQVPLHPGVYGGAADQRAG